MESAFRILILDDERIVCDRLRPSLEKLGFLVETCTDSSQAVARLTEQRFDVLVTDLKMPGVGGLDVLAFTREHCPATKPFKMSRLRDLIVRLAGEVPGRASAPKNGGPDAPVHE
jgi:CheY-like chemotaxis protein